MNLSSVFGTKFQDWVDLLKPFYRLFMYPLHTRSHGGRVVRLLRYPRCGNSKCCSIQKHELVLPSLLASKTSSMSIYGAGASTGKRARELTRMLRNRMLALAVD